jgi:hypothetical protein
MDESALQQFDRLTIHQEVGENITSSGDNPSRVPSPPVSVKKLLNNLTPKFVARSVFLAFFF